MFTKLVTRLATTALAISAHSKRLKHLRRCSFPGIVPQTLHPLMDICTTARPCRAASRGRMHNSTAGGQSGLHMRAGAPGCPGSCSPAPWSARPSCPPGPPCTAACSTQTRRLRPPRRRTARCPARRAPSPAGRGPRRPRRTRRRPPRPPPPPEPPPPLPPAAPDGPPVAFRQRHKAAKLVGR